MKRNIIQYIRELFAALEEHFPGDDAVYDCNCFFSITMNSEDIPVIGGIPYQGGFHTWICDELQGYSPKRYAEIIAKGVKTHGTYRVQRG